MLTTYKKVVLYSNELNPMCVCLGGLFWPLQWRPQAWHPEDKSVQVQQQAGGGRNRRTGEDQKHTVTSY